MTAISFVLTCRNAERSVAASVASILAIDDSVPFELVVVDDGSGDRTREILRSFSGRSLRIRVVENTSELGPAACRKIGAEEARGDYLFYLDADEFVAAAFVPEVYRELEARPDVVVVGRLEFDGRGFYSQNGAGMLFDGVRSLGGALEYPACFQDNCCKGKLMRARFLEENGLLFGTGPRAAEEFCARMWLQARNIRFFPKPLFVRDRQGCAPTESTFMGALAGAFTLMRLSDTAHDAADREVLVNAGARSLYNAVLRWGSALAAAEVAEALRRHYVRTDLSAAGRFWFGDDDAMAFMKRCNAGDFEGATQAVCSTVSSG